MKIQDILKREIEKIKPNAEEFVLIKKKAEEFVSELEKARRKNKIKAEVFIGGSLAKRTILKRKEYDIDIFVRFDKKYEDGKISELLAKLIRGKRIHGSRDYFQVEKGGIIFEVIPVVKVNKAKEARNVTDLSFFHVSYVKNKIKKKPKLADEIMLAKHFCYAQKCYGAESYIKGFSGYALELLIVYYKGFVNFLKAIAKSKEQIVIDPEKYYKNKEDVLQNLNEAKITSIVFVDPTFKERNALAGLSKETFEKFKIIAKKFWSKPSVNYFKEKEIDEKKFNLILEAVTNKQEGDIAGSKLLKFSNFLALEIEKYFLINNREFEYDNKKKAIFFFNIKKRKERILSGPPITSLENVVAFKKKHKHVFIKDSRVYAKEKVSMNVRGFVLGFRKENKTRMKDMGITGLKLG